MKFNDFGGSRGLLLYTLKRVICILVTFKFEIFGRFLLFTINNGCMPLRVRPKKIFT